MTSAHEPRRSARSPDKPGTTSHQAQVRVDERVKAIMADRDANSPEDKAVSARRFLRRGVKSSS